MTYKNRAPFLGSPSVYTAAVLVLGSGCVRSAEVSTPPQDADVEATSRPARGEARAVEKVDTATAIAQRLIIVDGHIDLPYRLQGSRDRRGRLTEDPTQRTAKGDMDLPRAEAGGLDAPFMSIYVPARYQRAGGAKKVADGLIDMVEELAARAPKRWAIAKSPEEVVENHANGVISLPLGIENGAALEDDLANVEHFARRGVSYITLTHAKDNRICDSSYDDSHTHRGLSEFGHQVVEAMNRAGIMVDVSHVSDEAFYHVMSATEVPVIASHSSCRRFTPGFERNMSDDMIRTLARKGGVIMINFGSSFLSAAAREDWEAKKAAMQAHRKTKGWATSASEYRAFRERYLKENPRVYATVEDVADHIDHVVKLVGVDHVGLGSDFDGVGDSLPVGLKDVSDYPNLIQVLMDRRYAEADLAKICGGNLLRVWRQAQRYARQMRSEK